MRVSKKLPIAVGGLAVLSGLYLKRLFAMKLSVGEKIALYNGEKILNTYKNILAFSAHPDDLEFFAGGTLALLTGRGYRVTVVDITDGEKGVRRKNLAPVRRNEQRNASRALKISELEFLHFPDLKLAESELLTPVIERIIAKIEPDVVFTFDYRYPIRAIRHPDHIAVGKVVTEAAKGIKGKLPEIVYYASRRPNSIIDISDAIEKKVRAVRCHKSQLRFSHRVYDLLIKLFARYSAKKTVLKHAETFRIE
ncbi:PIG-L deacetylase family protein [Desulfitibacter alkalitolerans]|uniref:PIG-L deacetylase family protein n=1 Tax=Desulfitibacter alkalitolerans TaxID=264641 RepID=UPI0006866A44|nr:PIG-L deacetylase family protein [Desulfitibacter alkalitolerans]